MLVLFVHVLVMLITQPSLQTLAMFQICKLRCWVLWMEWARVKHARNAIAYAHSNRVLASLSANKCQKLPYYQQTENHTTINALQSLQCTAAQVRSITHLECCKQHSQEKEKVIIKFNGNHSHFKYERTCSLHVTIGQEHDAAQFTTSMAY